VLYTGTLEAYQGVPLLLEAMVRVAHEHPTAVLTVLGGQGDQIEELDRLAASLGISDNVRLVGPVPTTLVSACLMAADVLVSPREQGKTTPLKIFSYLRSGRPIVATDIVSHTQILDGKSCVLVPPTAAGLASGIGCLLDDGPIRAAAIDGAKALRSRYGIDQFVSGVAAAYAHVGGEAPDATVVRRAAARISQSHSGPAAEVAVPHLLNQEFDTPLGVPA